MCGMHPPEFWHHDGVTPALLRPLGAVYGAAAWLRERTSRPWRASIPVICVGNLTVGGAGKTPTALALARILRGCGAQLAFLSRGYGGALGGPVQVDPKRHTARDVGDEPLLLSACAPTFIARNRKDGARLAAAKGAGVIVMDDGLQNPSLQKDLSLVVVDGGYGFGNGRVLPAGPLREPLARGLARADAFVLIGDDDRNLADPLKAHAPVLRARLVPDAEAHLLSGRCVLAFAGIGRPEKFFATLRALGAIVVATRTFADHHPYTTDEVDKLLDAAKRDDATPVTTAKDWVRLPEDARARVTPVRVELSFDDEKAVEALLAPTLRGAAAEGAHG
jgi:tetraacyldisaccharide 4'-kinase